MTIMNMVSLLSVVLLLLVWNTHLSPVASQTPQLGRQNTQCVNATIIPSVVTAENPYIENTNASFFTPLRDNAPPQVFTCPYSRDYGSYNPAKIGSVRSAWYKFTPSISNYYNITSTPLSGWVSIIKGALCYDGLVGTNDTSSEAPKPLGCRNGSIRGVYMEAGQSYQITVFIPERHSAARFPTGPFRLQIVPSTNRPLNDECSNATQIPSSVSLPYITTGIDVSGATIQPNETLPSCEIYQDDWKPYRYIDPIYKDITNFDGGSLWYTYTPPTTDTTSLLPTGRSGKRIRWPIKLTPPL
jgi:hypothetical protein